MKSHFRIGLCLAGLVLVGGTGCATRPPVINSEQAAAFRARAEAHFQRGFYLKPAEASNVATQAWQLAPLFIVEVDDTAAADLPSPLARPQVFFQSGHTMLNGRQHEQMTYWWTYPKDSRAPPDALPAQGVRITLDSNGQPVIWETLADTSGAELVFVAQSLELKALQQFVTPLKGRRFAVERAPAGAAGVVVARVIEDGPVTMGPIVYLQAGTRDVTTVICRCMEAQVRELSGQQEYELVSAPNATGLVRKLGDVQQRLRLPGNF
jgi:hypothetical protein